MISDLYEKSKFLIKSLLSQKPVYNKRKYMTSIQIWALVYFTCISIATWIFFGVIFLQLKRFMNLSKYIPIVAHILTVILIAMTIVGYLLIFIPNNFI